MTSVLSLETSTEWVWN